MVNISNKFLVFLLVIAILVSIIGTWYSIDRVGKLASLTGYAQTGYVNVTIGSKTEINVTQPYCGFGSGYVTPGNDFAVLHQGSSGAGFPGPYCDEASDTKGNWTNTTAYGPECMEVINLGNTEAFINVSSGKTTDQFIGGNSSHNAYKAWSENKEDLSCASGGLVNLVAYPGTEMDTTNITMCSCLHPDLTKNEMYVGCYLIIPKDAPIETKTDIWTFTATATSGVPDCGGE